MLARVEEFYDELRDEESKPNFDSVTQSSRCCFLWNKMNMARVGLGESLRSVTPPAARHGQDHGGQYLREVTNPRSATVHYHGLLVPGALLSLDCPNAQERWQRLLRLDWHVRDIKRSW